MLTLMANTSEADAVWCLIQFPGLTGNFPAYPEHVPFILPPNDGKVHDLSRYGPIGSTAEIGHLTSTYGSFDVPNPVEHLHADGCLGAPGKADGDNVALQGGSWTKIGNLAPRDDSTLVYMYTGWLHPSKQYWTYDRFGQPIKRLKIDFTSQVSSSPSPCQPLVTPMPSNGTPFVTGMEFYAPNPGYSWPFAHFIYVVKSAFQSRTVYRDYKRKRYFFASSPKGPPYWPNTWEYFTTYTLTGIRGNTSGTWTLFGTYKRVTNLYTYEGTSSQTLNASTVESTIELLVKAVYPGKAKVVPPLDIWPLAKHLYDMQLVSMLEYSPTGATAARNSALSNGSGLSSNNLENASQLSGSLSIFKDLILGYNAAKCGDAVGALKALSGAYLWYSYALAPGVSDSKEMVKKTDRLVNEIMTSTAFSNFRQRGSFETQSLSGLNQYLYYCTIHSKLDTKYFAYLWDALGKLGLQPTLGQGWDFVPFSFVLDWFLSVGPILRQIEAYLNMRYVRNVTSVIQTYNVKKSIPREILSKLTSWEVLGDYMEILYDRQISSQLGDFDPLAGQSESGLSLSQMAQGTSLLIQQLD